MMSKSRAFARSAQCHCERSEAIFQATFERHLHLRVADIATHLHRTQVQVSAMRCKCCFIAKSTPRDTLCFWACQGTLQKPSVKMPLAQSSYIANRLRCFPNLRDNIPNTPLKTISFRPLAKYARDGRGNCQLYIFTVTQPSRFMSRMQRRVELAKTNPFEFLLCLAKVRRRS